MIKGERRYDLRNVVGNLLITNSCYFIVTRLKAPSPAASTSLPACPSLEKSRDYFGPLHCNVYRLLGRYHLRAPQLGTQFELIRNLILRMGRLANELLVEHLDVFSAAKLLEPRYVVSALVEIYRNCSIGAHEPS